MGVWLNVAYLWLDGRIHEQFDTAKIITAGQYTAVGVQAYGINIGAVCVLWPHANRLKRKATVLCGPLYIMHIGHVRYLTAQTRIPCTRKQIKKKNNTTKDII